MKNTWSKDKKRSSQIRVYQIFTPKYVLAALTAFAYDDEITVGICNSVLNIETKRNTMHNARLNYHIIVLSHILDSGFICNKSLPIIFQHLSLVHPRPNAAKIHTP